MHDEYGINELWAGYFFIEQVDNRGPPGLFQVHFVFKDDAAALDFVKQPVARGKSIDIDAAIRQHRFRNDTRGQLPSKEISAFSYVNVSPPFTSVSRRLKSFSVKRMLSS